MSEQPANERGTWTPPPLTSQERIEQQRVGEALLTDDGRITNTGQAKTIAIHAVAERMRSSTPELVLSAFGLVVGTDMAHRLGDGRYVLVPHNEQYPSMGADVVHVGDLDAANPRHASASVVRMDDPHAEVLVRWIAVSELMGSWSYGSNNNVRVLALQEASREEFGLTNVLEWRLDPKTRAAVGLELDYNRDALREFLRTQYAMTQDVLAARGITELISYRALTWPEGAPHPEWADLNVGDSFQARHRPLASWSADRQIVADWLEQRGGRAALLVARKPAQDILAIPMTGIGFFGQKEWVTLPGNGPTTLDGIYSGTAPAAVEQTAASSIHLGAPVLDDTPDAPAERPAPALAKAGDQAQPLTVAAQLDPADPLDNRIIQILAGEEEFPSWWPQDDTGYAIRQRDLDFLGINPVQIKWMLTGEAPMGMTPELYQQFGTEMLEALQLDGIQPSQLDIRLKGSGAGFFSGIHKSLPREEDLLGNPVAAQRLRDWFDDDQDRPARPPHDSMWRLGLDSVPSDFDLDINSTAIVQAARAHWQANHPDRYPGDFMGGHGYLDKQTAVGTLPALGEWASRWERTLGRQLSLGVFESTGPFDATVLGRALSSHFLDTDWIIHQPDTPMAWHTPRSKITDLSAPPVLAPQLANTFRPENWAAYSDAQLGALQEHSQHAAVEARERARELHQQHIALRTAFAQQDGGAAVTQLRAQGASAETVERARAAAVQDIAYAEQTAVKSQTASEAAAVRAQAIGSELQRRAALSPQQRRTEELARQALAPQRTAPPPVAPRRPEPKQQPPGQSRSM
ncbi:MULTISPECIES: hypothetical protein [unclassified Streptomyces]|uniref:hypothetical protein n=1 Tax=unclassified Streptomyces TaxID=2593676 RepID=UPI00081EACA3|nr:MULTISPECIES: hypothetical protein [unclassified Streptomyces]SCF60610.1 hypothetical protein GA0115259_1000918 [Streptomyces sp. MnatMP-M17]